MSNEFIPNHACAPPAIPEPLEDWIAVAVDGLAPRGVRQLRAEYRAHIADALEYSIAEGKGESEAVENLLHALGDPQKVARQLRKEHLTRTDMKLIGKVSKRDGGQSPKGFFRAIARNWTSILIPYILIVNHGWLAMRWPYLILYLALIVAVAFQESRNNSPTYRLALSSFSAPLVLWMAAVFIIWSPVPKDTYVIRLSIVFIPLLLVWPICSLLLLLKLRRLERSASRDPGCRE